MKKINLKLKNIDKLTLLFILVILFSIFGFINTRYGKHDYKEIKITYKEKSDIDYKVYLKKNNFFTEEYLEKNKTYITSLINYLDIDFNHQINMSKKLSGKYSYYIKGVISANKVGDNSNSYWKKEYKLSNPITKEYSNTNKLEINENIKVDYQKYNDILTQFKGEYGLSMDGNFKVVLVLSNTINEKNLDREILKETELELNIPLTSLTIEVPIKTNTDNNETLLVDEIIPIKDKKYFLSKIVGYVCFILATIFLLLLLYLVILEIKKESIYHKKLKKILRTYDSIIVTVNSMPKLIDLNIIKVNSFEELIDAHSEIRKPINFLQTKYGSTFILISEGIAWKYTLSRSLFSSNNSNNKKVENEKNPKI